MSRWIERMKEACGAAILIVAACMLLGFPRETQEIAGAGTFLGYLMGRGAGAGA